MSFRFAVGALLSLTLFACSKDSAGPPPPPPPPPPPAVSEVVAAPWPSQIVIQNNILYWVDTSSTPFNKLSLAGSANPAGLFTALPPPENELSDGTRVYWVSGATLYSSTFDGSTTTVLDQGTGPGGGVMALDATHVYWANSIPQNTCSPACTFAIRRASKTGGAATTIATTTNTVSSIRAIAVAGDYVFWEEESGQSPDSIGSTGSKIMKISISTGTISEVVNGRLNGLIPPPSPSFDPATWFPRGGMIADTDFVYFGDADFFQKYRVMRAPVSGDSIVILLADTTHTASDFVRSMTSDDTTLYWVDENDLRSIPKAGGAVTDLAAARPSTPTSLTRAGTNLYWIETNRIFTIPTAGGTPTVVHDNVVTPVSIASDPIHLFWIEGGPYGDIEGYAGLRVSALDGTNVTTVMEAARGGRFATDGNVLYFANKWTLKAVAATGGTPRRLAIGSFGIVDVATDGQRVYWLEDGPFSIIRSVSVNGGPDTTGALASGPGPANRLRMDGTYVYWLGHNDEIDRVPKAGGPSIKLVGPIPGGATDFAIDASNIYISGWDSGHIFRMPLTGGTLTQLNTGTLPDQTRRIEANGGKVYWIDQLELGSVTADGQTHVSILQGHLTDPFSPNSLAFDSQSVYWTEVLGDVILKATPK